MNIEKRVEFQAKGAMLFAVKFDEPVSIQQIEQILKNHGLVMLTVDSALDSPIWRDPDNARARLLQGDKSEAKLAVCVRKPKPALPEDVEMMTLTGRNGMSFPMNPVSQCRSFGRYYQTNGSDFMICPDVWIITTTLT
ncbi:MAG: hypothetical protein WCT40_00140 [Candidatus Magasanikbacteria bacterium]|jgi:hypothetical protein